MLLEQDLPRPHNWISTEKKNALKRKYDHIKWKFNLIIIVITTFACTTDVCVVINITCVLIGDIKEWLWDIECTVQKGYTLCFKEGPSNINFVGGLKPELIRYA